MNQMLIALAATTLLAGCVSVESTTIETDHSPLDARGGARPAPDTMRWLYGSGEAAGASIQTWRAIADFAIERAASNPDRSVAMGLPDSAGGVADASCSGKPPAVVFDVDETVLLNVGYEYWQALSGKPFDPDEWKQWADGGAGIALPVPGAVTGLRRLREAGLTPVFNTNRNSDTAAGTIAAIEAAGAGPAVHLETLFLRGDDAMGSRKDGRRATIAARYCVIALAGDNLGDFADVFNADEDAIQARRAAVARGEYAQLWGNGWFLIPNPVYGSWQNGSVDDVFPPETRWNPNETESE